jgi:hypothetical protein
LARFALLGGPRFANGLKTKFLLIVLVWKSNYFGHAAKIIEIGS